MYYEDEREKKINRILMIAIFIMLAIILLTSLFYLKATNPYRQARSEAVKIASQYGKLDSVDDFYWFNRKKTYFSVGGTDDAGKKKYVIIAQKGGKVKVVNQKDGFNEAEIRQVFNKLHPDEAILKVNLGQYDSRIAWEVVTEQNQYYLFDFETGKAIQKV